MLPQVVTVGPLAAASSNNICASQTPGGAVNLTINGSAASGGVATLDVARRVLITSAGNDSGRTFTVTGTNHTGNAIQEKVTGGNATGVFTISDFKTVTKVAVDAATAGAVTVGTNAVASGPWKIIDWMIAPSNISFAGIVVGTVTWQIDYSYDNPNSNQIQPQGNAPYPAVPNVFKHPVLNAEIGNADSSTNDPIYAWRLTVTAGATGTSSVTATAIQAGSIPGA